MLDKPPKGKNLLVLRTIFNFQWRTESRPYPICIDLDLSISSKNKISIFYRQCQCQSQCLRSFHDHSWSNSAESSNDPSTKSQWIYGPNGTGPDQRFALNILQVVQQRNWFLIEILADKYSGPIFKCLQVNMRLLTPAPSLNTFSNVPSKPQCVHPSKSNLLARQMDSLRIRLHPGGPIHTKHPCKFQFTAQSRDKDKALKVPLYPSVIRFTSAGTLER